MLAAENVFTIRPYDRSFRRFWRIKVELDQNFVFGCRNHGPVGPQRGERPRSLRDFQFHVKAVPLQRCGLSSGVGAAAFAAPIMPHSVPQYPNVRQSPAAVAGVPASLPQPPTPTPTGGAAQAGGAPSPRPRSPRPGARNRDASGTPARPRGPRRRGQWAVPGAGKPEQRSAPDPAPGRLPGESGWAQRTWFSPDVPPPPGERRPGVRPPTIEQHPPPGRHAASSASNPEVTSASVTATPPATSFPNAWARPARSIG